MISQSIKVRLTPADTRGERVDGGGASEWQGTPDGSGDVRIYGSVIASVRHDDRDAHGGTVVGPPKAVCACLVQRMLPARRVEMRSRFRKIRSVPVSEGGLLTSFDATAIRARPP